MLVKEVVSRYESYIKRQHSNGTYRFYVNHLGHFSKWLEQREIYDIEDLKYYIFDDYISDMKRTCANITINKRIGILKRCFKHMNIDLPYLQSIEKLRERVHTYEMIELEDLKMLRTYHKGLDDDIANNLFYKCLILLLMDTGARINEILHIKKSNVNLAEGEILLTETKTKTDRTVYIQNSSIKYIKKMYQIKHDHPYLLHHKVLNREVNYFDVDNYMKKLRSIFGFKKLHAHMFRHSLATILLQRSADIVSVMSIMGHKNMETTQRYQHAEKKHVKKTYKDKFNLD
jgi:integrase/recombinase XerC/integrase/recombinase XerD